MLADLLYYFQQLNGSIAWVLIKTKNPLFVTLCHVQLKAEGPAYDKYCTYSLKARSLLFIVVTFFVDRVVAEISQFFIHEFF